MVATLNKSNIKTGKQCPYCGSVTSYVDSKVIYGKSYGMIYLCSPCHAYVGVHKGTNAALGRLANAELRALKKSAHAAFDPLWKNGKYKRPNAYGLLAARMHIDKSECHIGMFDIEQCQAVIEICKEL